MRSTSQKNTLCVPTSTTCAIRQSKLTTAPCSAGAPVFSTNQLPAPKRSSITSVRPPNTADRSSWSDPSVFTHSTRLVLNTTLRSLARFMHTSKVGGSSVTLHTADAVKPPRPAGPSVVTTFTAAPRRAIASRYSWRSTVKSGPLSPIPLLRWEFRAACASPAPRRRPAARYDQLLRLRARSAARRADARRQRGGHEGVKVAVQHCRRIAALDAGAKVLHQLVRRQNVAADLMAPADVCLGILGRRRHRLPLLQLGLVEPCLQHRHRGGAVAVLAAIGLAGDDDAARQMGDADRT